jgi:hypothetical protein
MTSLKAVTPVTSDAVTPVTSNTLKRDMQPSQQKLIRKQCLVVIILIFLIAVIWIGSNYLYTETSESTKTPGFPSKSPPVFPSGQPSHIPSASPTGRSIKKGLIISLQVDSQNAVDHFNGSVSWFYNYKHTPIGW